MKKLFAMLLAVAMIFSLATVAFAEEAEAPAETKLVSEAVTFSEVFKAYEVVGSTDEALFPAETLKFEVEADEANPDATVITVDDLAVTGNAGQLLTIKVPSYEKVGVYKYTISEVAGTTQGVTYTDDTIDVTVLVTYNYKEGKLEMVKADGLHIVEQTKNSVTVEATDYVHAVALEGNGVFSDSYFSLLPGQRRTISFTLTQGEEAQITCVGYTLV